MKTVGVITMHRVPNYGSLLQTYATQEILKRLGCKCEIIDYVFPNEYQFSLGYEHHSMSLKNRISKALGLKASWRMKNKLERFTKQHINLSQTYPNSKSLTKVPPHYDIYLTGSDQVWNPLHMKGDGTFLLDFAPTDFPKVAFSASFADKELPEEYISHYADSLNRYNAISVREESSQKLVKQLIGKDVPITLDPTLMLDADEWKALANSKRNKFEGRKYIVLYLLKYAFDPRPYIYELVRYLQEKTGCSIYSFSKIPKEFGCKDVHCFDDASPIEFLQLFTNASYVVTSSFHGTSFAINFGIPLFSLVDDTDDMKDDRQKSLLKRLHLTDCIVRKNTPFESIKLNTDIMSSVYIPLSELRAESMCYLENVINSPCI